MSITIKFHLSNYLSPECARYQHTSVVLAEGLQDLGIKYFGNIDYWWDIENNEYLIQEDNKQKADVHVYSSHVLLDNPDYIKKVDWSAYNVLLDNEDGFDSPAMDPKYFKFNLILRCHFNKKFWHFSEKMPWAQEREASYLPQVKPWNFGLSRRIINSVDKYRDLVLQDKVLCNFRMPHNIRKIGVEEFNKVLNSRYEIFNNITDNLDINGTDDLKSYWSQTGRRHNEVFYKDINSSMFTYAFGGKLWQDPVGNNPLLKAKVVVHKVSDFLKKRLTGRQFYSRAIFTMTQYGGWRIFESFLSNTVPIQIDFDYWGCVWPETPIGGVHYWSVKGMDFESSAKELMKLNDQELKNISDAGRDWVLKHYSPEAVAKRFLEHIR